MPSFSHTLIFVPPLFSYPCWAENSNMTWKFLRHSKVFMYFHKSLHYFFIVLSYIGFSFFLYLISLGINFSLLCFISCKRSKISPFSLLVWHHLQITLFLSLTTSLPSLESLLYVRPSAGSELAMISSDNRQKCSPLQGKKVVLSCYAIFFSGLGSVEWAEPPLLWGLWIFPSFLW